MNKKVLSLVQGAMIAALYAGLFYAQNAIFPGTATMAVQFRVAELMCVFALHRCGENTWKTMMDYLNNSLKNFNTF